MLPHCSWTSTAFEQQGSDHDTTCGCYFLAGAGHTVDIYSLTGSQPFDLFTLLK